jgi:hypothetical protein
MFYFSLCLIKRRPAIFGIIKAEKSLPLVSGGV